MQRLAREKQLKNIVLLKGGKKRIKIWLSRVTNLGLAGTEGKEGLWGDRTARLREARSGLNNSEQTCTESLQGQDRMVRRTETIQKWGQAEETVEIYLLGCVGNKQNNNQWPRQQIPQSSCTGNRNFGLSVYKEGWNKDRERLLTKISSDRAGQGRRWWF